MDILSFDEFVQHGLAQADNVVGGVPWSFKYKGRPVTHENDDLYLIDAGCYEGNTIRFARGEMLLANDKGQMLVCELAELMDAGQ